MKIHYTISLRVLTAGWTVEVYLPDNNTLLSNLIFTDPKNAVFHGCEMLKRRIEEHPQGLP